MIDDQPLAAQPLDGTDKATAGRGRGGPGNRKGEAGGKDRRERSWACLRRRDVGHPTA